VSAVAVAVVACGVCSTERMVTAASDVARETTAVLAARQGTVVGISEMGAANEHSSVWVSASESSHEKMTRRAWAGAGDKATEDDRLKAVVRILWKIIEDAG
jgi:hypothetical protein